jgi:hypothetical protein
MGIKVYHFVTTLAWLSGHLWEPQLSRLREQHSTPATYSCIVWRVEDGLLSGPFLHRHSLTPS